MSTQDLKDRLKDAESIMKDLADGVYPAIKRARDYREKHEKVDDPLWEKFKEFALITFKEFTIMTLDTNYVFGLECGTLVMFEYFKKVFKEELNGNKKAIGVLNEALDYYSESNHEPSGYEMKGKLLVILGRLEAGYVLDK